MRMSSSWTIVPPVLSFYAPHPLTAPPRPLPFIGMLLPWFSGRCLPHRPPLFFRSEVFARVFCVQVGDPDPLYWRCLRALTYVGKPTGSERGAALPCHGMAPQQPGRHRSFKGLAEVGQPPAFASAVTLAYRLSASEACRSPAGCLSIKLPG